MAQKIMFDPARYAYLEGMRDSKQYMSDVEKDQLAQLTQLVLFAKFEADPAVMALFNRMKNR
jgi:hypothetical protein